MKEKTERDLLFMVYGYLLSNPGPHEFILKKIRPFFDPPYVMVSDETIEAISKTWMKSK